MSLLLLETASRNYIGHLRVQRSLEIVISVLSMRPFKLNAPRVSLVSIINEYLIMIFYITKPHYKKRLFLARHVYV